MTANELMELLNKRENVERNKFLDTIYDEYFDTGITPEQRMKMVEILEVYENGELVEV